MWNWSIFEAVGNHMGKFLHIREVDLSGMDRRVGNFLVDIDMSLGLFEKIDIEWRGRTITQSLDYWGLDFRCHRCKEIRHLWRECALDHSSSSFEESLEDIHA